MDTLASFSPAPPDRAIACFVLLAQFLGVPADPGQIHHDRGKGDAPYDFADLISSKSDEMLVVVTVPEN